jgi:hypothetical protein
VDSSHQQAPRRGILVSAPKGTGTHSSSKTAPRSTCLAGLSQENRVAGLQRVKAILDTNQYETGVELSTPAHATQNASRLELHLLARPGQSTSHPLRSYCTDYCLTASERPFLVACRRRHSVMAAASHKSFTFVVFDSGWNCQTGLPGAPDPCLVCRCVAREFGRSFFAPLKRPLTK